MGPVEPKLLAWNWILAEFWMSDDGGVNVSLFFIAVKNLSHPHAAEPSSDSTRAFHASTSIADGLTKYMPLIAVDPPSSYLSLGLILH